LLRILFAFKGWRKGSPERPSDLNLLGLIVFPLGLALAVLPFLREFLFLLPVESSRATALPFEGLSTFPRGLIVLIEAKTYCTRLISYRLLLRFFLII
jgi:hypothetical protein